MRPLLWMALLALTLAPALTACNGASSAGQDLAGVQGLRPVLQHYYEARATEENGRCRSPLLDGVLNATVLQDDPQRLVVRVRYLYRDHSAELRGACIGFGNRTFTIDKGPDGPMVVEMSGAQHPRGLRLRLAS
jgi:predicted small secreted protein